jgi:ssDNA-binding Zn-finger/Zn-ribbon topoisomerase 1
VLPADAKCPECGKPLVIKEGRFGKFVGCSGYPQCKYRPPRK